MATELTSKEIISSDMIITDSLKDALNYYERVSSIIRKTHTAMGKGDKPITFITASTANDSIHTNKLSSTH